jgi:hypothetical protein
MSCGDAMTMSSAKPSGAAAGETAAAPAAGVSLGSALERLLYFNGRFLKAEDLKLEQTGYLKRIALSERAQGAGVSYGFHVTAQTSAAPNNFVKSVADAVFAKMQANRTEWVDFLDDAEEGEPPLGDDALIDRLAGALDALCGASPGNASGLVFTIAPGHAADGYGHDLLLEYAQQVKLSKLIDAFTTTPMFTDAPGPVVTPKPMTTAPPLTGAFLLTIHVNHHDHGNVPVYGAQCTDAKTAACSLGYRANGVSAQLVFFAALDGAVAAAEWWNWRGMGARAYFEAETATRPSKLPEMLATLPFSAAAQAPETGTHVPIGVVYLQNGNFVTFDPWTSKRLRSQGELTYWLRALLYPPQVSQLARVLQFESQLTDALSGGVAGGTTNLWQLGFADAAELVLPGVGFLPISIPIDGEVTPVVTAALLTPYLDAYFDGVPYKIIEATEGEMNAVFVGALESVELRLTRTAPSGGGGGDDCEEVITAINTSVDAWLAAPTSRPPAEVISEVNDLVDGFTAGGGGGPTPVPTGPAQVFVWFHPTAFPGHVMFTWPAPLPTATEAPALQPRVCTQVRLRSFIRGEDLGDQYTILAHDGEWAAPFVSGMGSFYLFQGLRLELENPVAGLQLNYAWLSEAGADILPGADGWLMETSGVQGLRVWLTGAQAASYSVLYRLRLRLGPYFYIDSPTFQNGQVASAEVETWPGVDADGFRMALEDAFRTYNPDNPNPDNAELRAETVWASIVPRCPSETTPPPARGGPIALAEGADATVAFRERLAQARRAREARGGRPLLRRRVPR